MAVAIIEIGHLFERLEKKHNIIFRMKERFYVRHPPSIQSDGLKDTDILYYELV